MKKLMVLLTAMLLITTYSYGGWMVFGAECYNGQTAGGYQARVHVNGYPYYYSYANDFFLQTDAYISNSDGESNAYSWARLWCFNNGPFAFTNAVHWGAQGSTVYGRVTYSDPDRSNEPDIIVTDLEYQFGVDTGPGVWGNAYIELHWTEL